MVMRGVLLFSILSLLVYISVAENTEDGSVCSITPPAKPYRMSVCTMIRNEGKTIEEWLAYHLLIKVDHFFIYDDGSTDNIASVLAPYVKLGLVTVIPWGNDKITVDVTSEWIGAFGTWIPRDPIFTLTQRLAIADCLFNHQNESEWFGVFDVDEFLVLNKFFPDMHAFVSYVNADDYHIPMAIYGPSKTTGWTFKNYQQRNRLTRFGVDYHNKFIGKSLYKSGCGLPNVHISNELRPGCRKYQGWITAEVSGVHLPLTINHYPIKSWDHYVKKLDMWNFGLQKEDFDKFVVENSEIWDNSMERWIWKIEKMVNCMRDSK